MNLPCRLRGERLGGGHGRRCRRRSRAVCELGKREHRPEGGAAATAAVSDERRAEVRDGIGRRDDVVEALAAEVWRAVRAQLERRLRRRAARSHLAARDQEVCDGRANGHKTADPIREREPRVYDALECRTTVHEQVEADDCRIREASSICIYRKHRV